MLQSPIQGQSYFWVVKYVTHEFPSSAKQRRGRQSRRGAGVSSTFEIELPSLFTPRFSRHFLGIFRLHEDFRSQKNSCAPLRCQTLMKLYYYFFADFYSFLSHWKARVAVRTICWTWQIKKKKNHWTFSHIPSSTVIPPLLHLIFFFKKKIGKMLFNKKTNEKSCLIF